MFLEDLNYQSEVLHFDDSFLKLKVYDNKRQNFQLKLRLLKSPSLQKGFLKIHSIIPPNIIICHLLVFLVTKVFLFLLKTDPWLPY